MEKENEVVDRPSLEPEYYIGYIRNPMQKITNGFQEAEEFEVLLMKDFNDFREVSTRAKVYLMDKQEVFDGHKVYKSQASLIGRVGRKLTIKEVNQFIKDIRENRMEEYINMLDRLITDTRRLYTKGELDYQLERNIFAIGYGVDASKVSDRPTIKRTK